MTTVRALLIIIIREHLQEGRSVVWGGLGGMWKKKSVEQHSWDKLLACIPV